MVWMITIEKKYCKAILDGRKKIELRTRIPLSLASGDSVLVCMKGSKGKVPFYFIVDAVINATPRILWDRCHHQLAIDEKDYLEYVKGRSRLYGLRIGHVYKYLEEVNITDFRVPRAPQWFWAVPCAQTAFVVGSAWGN